MLLHIFVSIEHHIFSISKFFIYFIAINYTNSWNNIGAEGVKGLGTALTQLKKLKQLSISIGS